jgi:hypothetical protein
MDLLLSLKAVNLKDQDFKGNESSKDIMERVSAARESSTMIGMINMQWQQGY